MANRYWVPGGTNTWISGSTTNWSATSGGAGGASVPGTTDDVIFDAGSGTGTATVSGTVQCRSVVAGTYTGTLAGTGNIQITGSNAGVYNSGKTIEFNIPGSMTYSYTGAITMSALTSSGSINFNGQTHSTGTIQLNSANGIWTLANPLVTTGLLSHAGGSLTTNNYNITCNNYSTSGTAVRALNLGSSIITLTTTANGWSMASTTNFTFNAGTSTIRFTNTGNTTVTFNGGDLTYYNLEFARGASTGQINIQGNNTYYNFIDNTSTGAHTYSFVSSSTHTFENFTVRGASSSARIILARSGTLPANFVKSTPGIITCDYLNLSVNATSVTPANTWYAGYNSIGTSTGWVLRNPLGMLTMGVGG